MARGKRPFSRSSPDAEVDESLLRVSLLCGEPSVHSGTAYVPLRLGVRTVGALGVTGYDLSRGTLDAIGSLAGLSIERVRALEALSLEERVAERTRIARDLHDTMLQSFQGLMMKFYTLTCIPNLPAEACERLESLLQEGQQALDEGRDAVRGMRASTVIQNDLACTLATVGERLAGAQNAQSPVDFRVVVEGESRDLHPILRDEVYRIASEATRNSFRHSGATRIEVEICYDDRQFRVRVEDNGKGIDPKVLDGGGREGHYGFTRDARARQTCLGKVNCSE